MSTLVEAEHGVPGISKRLRDVRIATACSPRPWTRQTTAFGSGRGSHN